MESVLDVRGTPAEQIGQYLCDLGGTPQPNGSYTGPGWCATLEESDHRAFGSIFPRVIIRWSGEPEPVKRVMEQLKLRATRVGG